MNSTTGVRPIYGKSARVLRLQGLVLAVLFFCTLSVTAQRTLSLHITHWTGRPERIVLHEGEPFSFRIKNNPYRYHCTIEQLRDSTIFLEDSFSVVLKDLHLIYYDKGNSLTHAFSKFFMYLGPGYVALDAINNATSNMQPIVGKDALIASGSVFIAGVLLKVAFLHRYKVGTRCSLWILS
jgi:hypothetical protein